MDKENVSWSPDEIVETATKELETVSQAQGLFSSASLLGAAIGSVFLGPIGLLVAAGAGGIGTIAGKEWRSKKRTRLIEVLSTYGAVISPRVREKAVRVLTQQGQSEKEPAKASENIDSEKLQSGARGETKED